MPYKVYFLSLGCAKNQVNCEQMMSLVQAAGHEIVPDPAGADAAVVNTCGWPPPARRPSTASSIWRS